MSDSAPVPANLAPPAARSGDGLEAGVQIGDFKIERRIGAGGMGIVYQARQISLNRTVALKVLGQSLKRPSDVARFQREAQAAARLSHPGVASIYFIGQDRHICYLVMELVEGVSLRRVLDRLGNAAAVSGLDTAAREELAYEELALPLRFDQPTAEFAATPAAPAEETATPSPNPYLSPQALRLRGDGDHIRRCCEIVRDVARALAHAHERGVVHRDIKPDNILLDKSGKVRVIDFGVARFFDDLSVTYTGQLVGTPLYMSPEQVTGRGSIDQRSDLYSLGLVLYELLTLRPPLEPENREHLLRTIITKPLPPVPWRNKAIPEPLSRIVHKATQKDPDQRYSNAADLMQDLDRYLAGQSVAAPPYHFRLDEREVVAARPGSVVVAAFVFFVASFFLFMLIEATALLMGTMFFRVAGPWLLIVQSLIAVAILAAGLTVGWGLLSARVWARWGGVALSALLLAGSLAALGGVAALAMAFDPADITPTRQDFADPNLTPEEQQAAYDVVRYFPIAMVAMYTLPPLAMLALSITALAALLGRRTAEWFQFARDLRREHRQLRDAIQ